jgi:DUF4097 and DUF4098 domain-containing protein YvlB
MIVFLCYGAGYGETIEETFKQNISFQQGGYLSISNFNGYIKIIPWDKSEVEIVAHKEVRASDQERAEKLMQKLNIIVAESNDKIEIETDSPRSSRHGSGFFDWLLGKGESGCSVSYELKVPFQIDLNLITTNGEINIQGISGRVRMQSTNGEITAEDIKGFVRCKTTNGSIRVGFIQIPGDDEISFKTTNGSVTLYLPSDYAGSVDLETTNGDIETDFPLKIKKKWSRKHIKGLISSGGGEIQCSTTNGDIQLYYNNQI